MVTDMRTKNLAWQYVARWINFVVLTELSKKACTGVEVYVHLFLNSALDWSEESASHPGERVFWFPLKSYVYVKQKVKFDVLFCYLLWNSVDESVI